VKALRCGGERWEPVVRRTGEAFEVELAGRVYRFDLLEEGPGVFVFRDDRRAVRFHVVRSGRTAHLSWDGTVWDLEEEREGARAARRQDSGALEAPMPGRVAAVRVAPGQRVKKGEELLVVEAMKMENALRAPRDGVVAAVHAAVDDTVAPGRPLVEMEAEG
jgi:3-methylcrotonyl-CoA carboxylase alpha subunit